MGNHTRADTLSQKIRLCWIERFAHQTGAVKRTDIAKALGISRAQASSDLQRLHELHPGCLDYDLRAKTYRWADQRRTPKLSIPDPVRYLAQFIPPS